MIRAAALAAAVGAAACKPLPPAPLVALHDDTAAAPVDTTTALVVVGIAGELFASGVGAAIRVERQVTSRTAIGGELMVGRGDGDDEDPRVWVVAARGFGHGTPRAHDWVALTYGLGLAWMSTGLVSATVHGGGALSYPNGYGTPYLQLGLAPVVVLRPGRPMGDGPALGAPDPPRSPRSDVFWLVDVGAVGLVGDTGNRLSIDLGMAGAMIVDDGVFALSVADGQRFAP